MKTKIYNRGFTLIELLAVLTLIVTVGAIVLAIVLSSLRATNKSNVISDVRQNGDFAINQISRTIQYAKSFEGVSSNGLNYKNDCTVVTQQSPSLAPTPVPIKYKSVRVKLFDESLVTFTCAPVSFPTSVSVQTNTDQPTDLINTALVKTSQCYFTCSQKNLTDPPSIGIHLDLKYALTTNFAEGSSSIPFDTTITMRNSNK